MSNSGCFGNQGILGHAAAAGGPHVPDRRRLRQREPDGAVLGDLGASGGRGVPLEERKARVDAEVDRLVAAGAVRVREVRTEGIDHYAVAMRDPEGNEFDVN